MMTRRFLKRRLSLPVTRRSLKRRLPVVRSFLKRHLPVVRKFLNIRLRVIRRIQKRQRLPVEDEEPVAKSCRLVEDEEEPFDLKNLPSDLHRSVIQKMEFHDLKKFNFANRLSAEMCKGRKVLEVKVDKVYIYKSAESFKNGNKKGLLSSVKENVRLYADTLELEKPCLKTLKKYKITAEWIDFMEDTGSNSDFVKNVLELVNPEYVDINHPSMETLHLEQVKKLDFIRFWPNLDFNDESLLSVKLDAFDVMGQQRKNSITTNGVLRFLQEWKMGEREIRRIQINVRNFDEKLILPEFPGHPQNLTHQMVLCREDGESDILLDARWPGIAKLRSVPCPGHGIRIHHSPTRHVPYAFRGRTRSPPL